MVHGIDFGKELLRFSGLPVVEPEIKVNPQFLFPGCDPPRIHGITLPLSQYALPVKT